jgi:hypothetical protein
LFSLIFTFNDPNLIFGKLIRVVHQPVDLGVIMSGPLRGTGVMI